MTGAQDPLVLALAFAQLFLEVECGRRPRATVLPLMTPRLAAQLSPFWVRGGPMRRPGAARGAYLSPDVYEAVVMAQGPARCGALVVRLERRPGGWRVTDAGRPEDGPLPEPEICVPALEPCAFDLVCPPGVIHIGEPDHEPVRVGAAAGARAERPWLAVGL